MIQQNGPLPDFHIESNLTSRMQQSVRIRELVSMLEVNAATIKKRTAHFQFTILVEVQT